jgi:hypothetical protein
MKQTLGCFFLIIVVLIGCKKGTGVPTPITSLNIVNASVDLGPITARFSGMNQINYWSQLNSTADYGANNIFTVLADVPISLAIATTDTLHPVYNGSMSLRNGDINTLFLAGHQGAVDSILFHQLMPYYYGNSCGIQFINLSYNSTPITITQIATPNVEEVSALAYKQYTPIKQYAAKNSDSIYNFQVLDAASKAVLSTYSLKTPTFLSVTLAWIGQQGGTGADTPRIMRINNYK